MAKSQSGAEKPDKIGFEDTLAELDEVVRELERGDLGLSRSLEFYERGVKLLRRCHGFLEKAERRIELLSGVDADGNAVTTPLDDTSLSLDEKAEKRSHRRSAGAKKGGKPADADPEAGDSAVDRSGKLF